MTVRISLFGDLAVEVDGARREGLLRGRHGRLLLAYLVLNRARAVSRAELVDALWGEHLPGDPSASLRAHLSRVRTLLGAHAVEGTERLRLRLPAGAWLDVDEAEAALGRAETAATDARWADCARAAGAAGKLTRAPLAPGLEADWLAAADAAREATLLRSLELLGTAALALDPPDSSTAEKAGRSLVERAPFRESGHRLVVRAALASGEAAEGLRAFDAVRTLLRDELGVAPSAELRSLHAELLDLVAEGETRPTTGWSVPPRLAVSSSFVGRASERAALAARAEAGAATVVEGEAGVGKTRLIAATAGDLRARGWAILYGRCRRDAPVPYQPFVEAFEGVIEALPEADVERLVRAAGPSISPLLPALAIRDDRPPGSPGAEVWRLLRAARRFVARLAAEIPVLLAIDDLHLADRATLGLVTDLTEANVPRGAVVATCRSGEAGAGAALEELVERIAAEGGAIRLEGLAQPEVAELLAGEGGEPSSAGIVEAVHGATGGNPLYAIQLARHLAEAEHADPGAWRAEGAASLPIAVRSLVARRVAALPAAVRATLSTAATIGHEFELDLLEGVTSRPRTGLLDDLELALRAGVVAEAPGDSGSLAFVHGLVQHALLEDQLVARREETHRRVAEELEGLGPQRVEPARLAHHWHAAGAHSDPARVVAHSRDAAERAASSLAFDTAATLYRRALEAGTEILDEGERTELLLALSRSERQAGALDAARAAAREAAGAARRTRDSERLARAALSHSTARTTLAVDAFDMEHAGEAASLLREAHDAVDGDDSLLRVRVLSELAAQRLSGLTVAERRELAREATAAASRLGDRRGELLALRARIAPSLRGPDELADLIAAAERAAALAGDLDDGATGWEARRSLCGAHFVRGDLGAVDREIARMEQIAVTVGDATQALGLAVLRAGRARFAGDLAGAERIRTEAIEGAPDPSPAAAAFGAQLWQPLWDAGRYGELVPSIEAVVAQAPQALALHGLLALLHCEAGELEPARERFERLASEGFALDADEFLLIGLTQTAMAASLLGDRERAQILHDKLTPYAGLNAAIGEQFVTNGPVDLYLGALEVTLGRLQPALDSLRRAEKLTRAWGDPVGGAVVGVHLARLLALRGEPEAARAAAAAATTTARALGLRRVALLAQHLGERWAGTEAAATF